MLRSITVQQFEELYAYSQIEPFGETRMDFRFALLASAIVGSLGGKLANGRAYTVETFLQSLRIDEQQRHVEQTTEQMEFLLKTWTDTSNRIIIERGLDK
jgi:hypothetical protein